MLKIHEQPVVSPEGKDRSPIVDIEETPMPMMPAMTYIPSIIIMVKCTEFVENRS